MIHSRLRTQGFINLYRKPILRLLAIALAAYLFYVPNPWPIDGLQSTGISLAGILLIFAGILGRIFSTISIGGLKDRIIVRTELYSVCRNPLYFASFLMAIGVGLLFVRLDFTILEAFAFIGVFYPMMRNETRFLRTKFVDYAEYEQQVPLFFPNLRLWNAREKFDINFRLVQRTLLDAALILIAIPLMLVLRSFA